MAMNIEKNELSSILEKVQEYSPNLKVFHEIETLLNKNDELFKSVESAQSRLSKNDAKVAKSHMNSSADGIRSINRNLKLMAELYGKLAEDAKSLSAGNGKLS